MNAVPTGCTSTCSRSVSAMSGSVTTPRTTTVGSSVTLPSGTAVVESLRSWATEPGAAGARGRDTLSV